MVSRPGALSVGPDRRSDLSAARAAVAPDRAGGSREGVLLFACRHRYAECIMISIRCLQLSLGLLLVTATHLPAQSVTGVDVPIAPLPPVAFAGWTNACRLANSALEVIIAPAVGRMVTLIPAGATNLLRLDPALAGLEPSATNTESWLNFGGDWFWPVAQSQWTPIQGRDWPPPPALAERPWQATA
jgi:hypothetical protein